MNDNHGGLDSLMRMLGMGRTVSDQEVDSEIRAAREELREQERRLRLAEELKVIRRKGR